MNQESKTITDQSLLRQTFYNSDDELDLLDVVAQLWSGKKTIILTVLVFLLLAAIYLFFAKEKWTSEAIVTQPSAGQVANYNAALNVLYSQYPQDKPGLADLQRQLFGRFSASLYALSGSLQNLENPLNLNVAPVTAGQAEP
ncbi:MAG: Wzz/FepE/Etk N-terminal domain-containing protein, partial [Mixta calida]|nr:Wzz/FepE/Etk N-terminal domain-containing protein [Mixta calida]